jgi:phospholipase C
MDNKSIFKNVVVLMLENRSFDNLLGYLYEDGVPKGKSFEGLQGGSISNPVPSRVAKNKQIEVAAADSYHQPYPDPGEEYQHVNTQLFNCIDSDNIGIDQSKMKSPYNIPSPMPNSPAMKGFVNDYINTMQALNGEVPSETDYSQIMQCFKPDKVPVLSTLAKEFAVFDHWFCSVPSQTWCNRAFWHASTSGGKVINAVGEGGSTLESVESFLDWTKQVWSQPTLFDRLKSKNKTYTIYADLFPLTCVVNGIDYLDDTKLSFNDFLDDAKKGALPDYSFIEPKFFGQHNDQHPSAEHKPTRDGSVLLGEKLIADVYNAIKNSPQRDDTLLIITHDEHGGCFDHVSPPTAIAPVEGMKGQKGFQFDRYGVRVPMVMISPYIEKNTIVNEVHDHSSFIKTLSELWGFDNLTDRDKNATPFWSVFSSVKRPSYPDIEGPTLQEVDSSEYDNDVLNGLQKTILKAVHEIAKDKASGSVISNLEEIVTIGHAVKYIEKLKEIL